MYPMCSKGWQPRPVDRKRRARPLAQAAPAALALQRARGKLARCCPSRLDALRVVKRCRFDEDLTQVSWVIYVMCHKMVISRGFPMNFPWISQLWLVNETVHAFMPLALFVLPSGKQPHNYRKSPFLMGNSTISTGPFSIAFCMFTRG